MMLSNKLRQFWNSFIRLIDKAGMLDDDTRKFDPDMDITMIHLKDHRLRYLIVLYSCSLQLNFQYC